MRRHAFWVLLSSLLLSVVATSCKNPNLSGGILHFDQKRFERARETLLRAIAQEPGNAEAWLYLGKAYAELDSTQEARAALEKAASFQGPKFPEAKSLSDNALESYWSQRHNEGLAAAKAAQEAKQLAKTQEAQKNFREALNRFKRARVYQPQKEETPRNMGVCYFNLGEIDSGLVALKESQKLAPGDEKAAGILFDQYRFLGDQAAEKGSAANPDGLRDAIKFYSEAEKIRPKDSDLLFSIGVVYFQLAEGDTARKREHYDTAADYFVKTLEIKPDDQEALQNAATLYLELKQCDEGLAAARKLVDLDPHNYRYHDILGRLNGCVGQKSDQIAGLVFSRSLRDGEVIPLDGFNAHKESFDAQSDLLRRYREEGKPEEIRTFKDTNGREYETWFYWTRGKAYAFYDGEFKYSTEFRPEQPKEEE